MKHLNCRKVENLIENVNDKKIQLNKKINLRHVAELINGFCANEKSYRTARQGFFHP